MKIISLILISFSMVFSIGLIKNEGQVDNSVLYYSKLKGMNFFIKEDGVYFDFYNVNKSENEVTKEGEVIKMLFDSKNFDFEEGKVVSKRNYFYGNDKSKWIKGADEFDEIILEDVFEDIDLRLYHSESSPRYDFIVHPGGDINQIVYSFFGNHELNITKHQVSFETTIAKITTTELLTYQIIDGIKKEVKSNFVSRSGKIGFEVSAYDPKYDLVIDPVVFGSFFGGTSDDSIADIFPSDNDEFVIAGTTSSADFPVTEGAYSVAYNFGTDGFVARLKSKHEINEPLWVTYFGGTQDEVITSCEEDDEGRVVFTGYTNSEDLPLQNAVDQLANGEHDVFLARLNSDGASLNFSTYIGGSKDDKAYDLLIKSNNEIYICGSTASLNFPTAGGPIQSNNANIEEDAFILKMSANGSFISKSTYFGGSGRDIAYALDIDKLGVIYLVGATTSSDFPLAPTSGPDRAYDESFNGEWDMFVTKLTNDIAIVETSSFYGGPGDDYAVDVIADDTDGSIFFLGYSNSDVNTTTVGMEITDNAYQKTLKGGFDIIYGKLSPKEESGFGGFFDTQSLIFSTYIGGTEDDIPTEFTDNDFNNEISIVGYTKSSNFPQETDFDERDFEGVEDGFLLKIAQNGDDIDFAEFYGGSGADRFNSIAIDERRTIHLVGETSSNNANQTDNAYNTENDSKSGWIVKEAEGEINLASPDNTRKYCRTTNLPIIWTLNSSIDNNNYKMQLINQENGEIFIVEEEYDGTSPYNWPIPADIPTGDYKFQLIHPSGLSIESDGILTFNKNVEITEFSQVEGTTENCIGDRVQIVGNVDQTGGEFMWKKDDQTLDETSSTLTIESLTKEDSGIYVLEVEGDCPPTDTSEEIEIMVLDDTEITQASSNLVVLIGNPVTLSVTAQGSNLEYQWYFEENELLGEIDNEYVIETATPADSGSYYCVVTGQCGEMQQSDDIILDVDQIGSVSTPLINNSALIINNSYLNDSKLIMDISSELSGKAKFELTNLNGKRVILQNPTLINGNQLLKYNLDQLARGIYTFRIILNSNVATGKLIID